VEQNAENPINTRIVTTVRVLNPVEATQTNFEASLAAVLDYLTSEGKAPVAVMPLSTDAVPSGTPSCPKCRSFALYRQNNLGNYECQTCGLPDITEETARRTQ
jgi:hypothetical protein